MLKGNKGEWSEPYALLKLLADGKLLLGEDNFGKAKGLSYPITKVLRHEKERIIDFSYNDKSIDVSDGKFFFKTSLADIASNAKLCFEKIKHTKKGQGTFEIPETTNFLSSFSIHTLKAKSKLKNDITIQINDPNTHTSPSLGFSIKSQLGSPSTLVNASGATNFTFVLTGAKLDQKEIDLVNNTRKFSDKFKLLSKQGVTLQFEKVDNDIFKSNLQTIDYNFEKILSEILIFFYSNDISSENSIAKLTEKTALKNSIGYDLKINSSIYELIMKKFLFDYALGMRAAEVWKRKYQATGGYLIVKDDGEIICYHFYFPKTFEEYLFNNTKLETPDPKKHGFGSIYSDNSVDKIKLNLQVRFIK
jgi:HpaII restriction endonuclease